MECSYRRINPQVWVLEQDGNDVLYIIRSPFHKGFIGVPTEETAPMMAQWYQKLPPDVHPINCPNQSDATYEFVEERVYTYAHSSGIWPDTAQPLLTNDDREGGET